MGFLAFIANENNNRRNMRSPSGGEFLQMDNIADVNNDTNSIYEDRVLAFVDILGFRSMIKDSESVYEAQKRIKTAMNIIHSYKTLNDSPMGSEQNDDKAGLRSLGIQITTFSDSAIISYPLSYDGALFYLIIDLIHLQMELLWLGILIRGGIVIGPAYHDSVNAFGPAMVSAYELESKKAIYPRIIMHPNTVKLGLKMSPSHLNDFDLELFKTTICQDADGYFFVEYLQQYQEFDFPEITYYEWMFGIRKMIVDNLNNTQFIPDVFAKYQWLLHYWNRTLEGQDFHIPIEGDMNDAERLEEWEKYKRLKIDSSTIPYT